MIINLWIIYAATLLGAVGVFLALPRRASTMTALGGLLAAAGLGIAMVALGSASPPASPTSPPTFPSASPTSSPLATPGLPFYVFSFLALAGALRMISHPRPVYAALYFILVILSSAGLILLLSAEFMAFALVIVYAGAILVTYLFVIMLAQEAPESEGPEALADYDAVAYEPVGAVAAGFTLLAMILSLMLRGTSGPGFPSAAIATDTPAEFALLTGKIERALRESSAIAAGDHIIAIDPASRSATVERASADPSSTSIITETIAIPESVTIENVEQLGVSLFTEFPLSLELAGVILMLAMLGAVVLARRNPFETNYPTGLDAAQKAGAMPAPALHGFRIGRHAGTGPADPPASPHSPHSPHADELTHSLR